MCVHRVVKIRRRQWSMVWQDRQSGSASLVDVASRCLLSPHRSRSRMVCAAWVRSDHGCLNREREG